MRVELTATAAQELVTLLRPIHARMLKIIERLHNWPHVSGVRPLRGKLAGHFRMRTGDYRLQFFVEGECIVVEKIGHRDGFYEE